MLIDFHTHIFPPEMIARRELYRTRDRWFGLLYADPRARMAGAEELISAMDEAGVGLAVVMGFAFEDQGLCREGNTYVLEMARRYPGRLIPFIIVNPCAGEAALAEARRGLELEAAGIGELMPDGQGFGLTDFARLHPLLELAEEYQVPIMTHVNEQVGHAYAGKGAQGPHEAYQLALRYPRNVFVLSHWGGGLPFYELMPEVRVALSNVYYDTAASLYLYDDAVFCCVARWAPTKILWGTDYPLISPRRFLRRLRASELDAPTLDQILGGNAQRVLHRFIARRPVVSIRR